MNSATDAVYPFPLAPPGTMGPPVAYEWMRQHCPLARVGLTEIDAEAWALTRYTDVRRALADPQLIRPVINDWPQCPGQPPRDGPGLTTMMEMDGPQHHALRRAVAPWFSLRHVRHRQALLRRRAEEFLNAIEQAGPPGDLVTEFAELYSLRTMCDLVGLPYEARASFLGTSDTALGALQTLDEGRRASDLLWGYISSLVDLKHHTTRPTTSSATCHGSNGRDCCPRKTWSTSGSR